MSLKGNALYQNELPFRLKYQSIAGVDEAGRGPLAGPVVIAAVILDPGQIIDGINDSKQLSQSKREKLSGLIMKQAKAYSIITITPARIDEINILQAVLEGMRQAVESLHIKADLCLIDGNKLPSGLMMQTRACIKGDATYASIAAASILAKVHRDNLMVQYDTQYPEYGFASHKGYPTPQHFSAIEQYGPCPIHRFTYAPVRQFEIRFKQE